MTDSPLAPIPVEHILLPADLDGSHGRNRAIDRIAQIAASNDLQAIHAWLARFIDTKTTFDNYRKEAERLLLWSTLQLGKPLSSLTHEDFLVYQQFLLDPQPREKWVSGDESRTDFLASPTSPQKRSERMPMLCGSP